MSQNYEFPPNPDEQAQKLRRQRDQDRMKCTPSRIPRAGPSRAPDFSPQQQSPTQQDIFIQDQYYPGALEDSIFHQLDFNELSAAAAGSSRPKTLLESFDERVQHEHKELQKHMHNADSPPKAVSGLRTPTHGPQLQKRLREENIRAHTRSIDLIAMQRKQPKNGLLHAIDCLHKAELMNGYDAAVQAATDAVQHVAADRMEEAAANAANAANEANTDVHVVHVGREVATTVHERMNGTFVPLEIVSYLGRTSPN